MILDNPALFKKVMQAYNTSKRQAMRSQTKTSFPKPNRRKALNDLKGFPQPRATDAQAKQTITGVQLR
jgi:hypothetical protein